ncbi:hypothetical protein QJS10_CPA16g01235 [Acorus calamus]|uniref:Signal recognition particle subunit SRP68 n=1 Tax=Acorus calamus TaxID=4465 RepID=A0AAV9D3R4_ACOCL|nr:hypothetical protein QJS10_CPA16g01235 [Acorus calamus]
MAKANVASAMDVDEKMPDSNEHQINPKFSINVLQMLKSAQMQHGLRQRDYTRYRYHLQSLLKMSTNSDRMRRYCTARLRRLYKSLKFTHGRGKYLRKAITESTVTEVRFLHVVLYTAERAWSHAMEKRHLADGPNARQRIYLLGRLRKAVKWASLFAQLCSIKGDSRTSLEAEIDRAVYEELGKYGSVENQVLCRERVEELEPSIRYCLHKIGQSSIQTSELLDIGEMEGPALDLFKAKLEAVMAETRSQQAASMTEFYWPGHGFPITNAKTRVSILKAQELEKELHGSAADSMPSEKKLAMFDKIFSAYHDARSCIRNDLVTAGNTENVKDDLNGLDKAVSSLLGQRTIERNQLLVSIAKSRLTRYRDDKGDKATKPEELVRLYDLLIQNTNDLTDLVSSGRERNQEEVDFAEEYILKGLIFRAESSPLALINRFKGKAPNTEGDEEFSKLTYVSIQEMKTLSNSCRSNSCIEHATGIIEEEKAPEKLSKGVSTISLTDVAKQPDKFLLEKLDVYESALSEENSKRIARIAPFPPAFQSVPCNPIVLDIVFSSIEFPSLEHRVKKSKAGGLLSRLWGGRDGLFSAIVFGKL